MMTNKFFDRRNKVRKTVAGQKLDALIITDPINVRYLTNFTGGTGFLLIKPDGDTISSDPRFTIQIEEECPGLNARIRPRSEPISKILKLLLGKTTAGKLGFEAESVTIARQERLFQELSHWHPVPTKNIVEELRQIKDKDEVTEIRKAVKIAAGAFQLISKFLQEMRKRQKLDIICEIALNNFLSSAMREHAHVELISSVVFESFPMIIGAGARAALPHGSPSTQIIAGQSHVLFDWGCMVNGYVSDLTRVLVFEPNNKKFRTIYETVLKAQEAAIAAIKPGKTCEEIDTVARNVIKDAGFSKHFEHGLGHSIGLQIHENPRFAPKDETVLKAGMVLTVEPGIYLKGWGGVRIEDDILVTRSGCDVLSRDLPKAFEDMVIQ